MRKIQSIWILVDVWAAVAIIAVVGATATRHSHTNQYLLFPTSNLKLNSFEWLHAAKMASVGCDKSPHFINLLQDTARSHDIAWARPPHSLTERKVALEKPKPISSDGNGRNTNSWEPLECHLVQYGQRDTIEAAGTHTNRKESDTDGNVSITSLYYNVTPSVVFISTFSEKKDKHTLQLQRYPLGTGSGIVYNALGHILTNYHVIDNSDSEAQTSITVEAYHGNQQVQYNASVVGVDKDYDVAVLKLEKPQIPFKPKSNTTNETHPSLKTRGVGMVWSSHSRGTSDMHPSLLLSPISRGNSDELEVGQTVMAIGNPYGLHHSLSVGVISGLSRDMRAPSGRSIANLIQTDAAINPGNSGGPLLNRDGYMIGMNAAIKSPSGGSSGIGFAIPINEVVKIADTIISEGKVIKGRLGFTLLSATDLLKQHFTLCNVKLPNGVLVLNVHSTLATKDIRGTFKIGKQGDISLGDIVYEVNKVEVSNINDITKALQYSRPGDTVQLKFYRAVPTNDATRYRFVQKSISLKLLSSETDPPINKD